MARAFHACAAIDTKRGSAVLVIGGITGQAINRITTNRVEILYDSSDAWVQGPEFPIPIRSATATTDLSLGVLVIGGTTDGVNPLATIYRLSTIDENITWGKLKATLSRPRFNHIALMVSVNFAACQNPSKR
jgi:hypothetical protein